MRSGLLRVTRLLTMEMLLIPEQHPQPLLKYGLIVQAPRLRFQLKVLLLKPVIHLAVGQQLQMPQVVQQLHHQL